MYINEGMIFYIIKTVKYVLILTEWNGERIKFVPTPDGLYYCDMRENSVLMVNSVK